MKSWESMCGDKRELCDDGLERTAVFMRVPVCAFCRVQSVLPGSFYSLQFLQVAAQCFIGHYSCPSCRSSANFLPRRGWGAIGAIPALFTSMRSVFPSVRGPCSIRPWIGDGFMVLCIPNILGSIVSTSRAYITGRGGSTSLLRTTIDSTGSIARALSPDLLP